MSVKEKLTETFEKVVEYFKGMFERNKKFETDIEPELGKLSEMLKECEMLEKSGMMSDENFDKVISAFYGKMGELEKMTNDFIDGSEKKSFKIADNIDKKLETVDKGNEKMLKAFNETVENFEKER